MATIQIADKPTLDEIKAQVASNNTEDAQGTIHQKLTAIWNYVKSVLGRPEDGGGTMTSGSITAKLNELLATWSVTRAGYVDRLANGTYGLDKIKADTGSILSKVNSGVSASVNYATYGTETTLKSLSSSISASSGATISTVFTFIAPFNGEYRIDASVTETNTSGNSGTSSSTALTMYLYLVPFNGNFELTSNDGCITPVDYYYNANQYEYKNSGNVAAGASGTISVTYRTYLQQGMSYAIRIKGNGYTTQPYVINSCTIKYTKK